MAIQRNTAPVKAYSFHSRHDTQEVHVFEGDFTPEGCTSNFDSICEKTNRRRENMQRVISCLNEDEAREKAAEYGRSVCGTCVSHLYTTY